jgi:hypothetical protein
MIDRCVSALRRSMRGVDKILMGLVEKKKGAVTNVVAW